MRMIALRGGAGRHKKHFMRIASLSNTDHNRRHVQVSPIEFTKNRRQSPPTEASHMQACAVVDFVVLFASASRPVLLDRLWFKIMQLVLSRGRELVQSWGNPDDSMVKQIDGVTDQEAAKIFRANLPHGVGDAYKSEDPEQLAKAW